MTREELIAALGGTDEQPIIETIRLRSGLIVVYSSDIPGLLVTCREYDEIDARLKRAIKQIREAQALARSTETEKEAERG